MTAQHGGDSNDALNVDFRDFIKTLNASRVEFVLVGGYAVGALAAQAEIGCHHRSTNPG